MEIKIFNVTHGFFACLVADNRNIMVFDCGHNERTGFRPSDYLPRVGCTAIERLIIQNFDQDHVSDLHNLMRRLPIDVLFRNRSVPVQELRQMKLANGPLTEAMDAALTLHGEYTSDVVLPPQFPGIEFKTFCNPYPEFEDTNNLSLVSFVHYDNMGVVFTGDLERAGWLSLLSIPSFREHLQRVNIFIASHHGRESGYCREVFNYCRPEIIIISDKEVIHETQKQRYQQHASGVPWNGGPERRYVLTTRSDDLIRITKTVGAGYNIQT